MDQFQQRHESVNARWWLGEDDAQVGRDLAGVYEALQERDGDRQEQILHHMKLYGNLPVEGMSPTTHTKVASRHRVTMNLIAACVDTATAKIGASEPIPRPLPVFGNYSIRRKCKTLERFFQAQYQISDVYSEARDMFRDAAIFGTGVLKCYGDAAAKKIMVERVFPGELIVDPHEALYGKPRTLLQRKWIARDVLREMFADAGETVLDAIEHAGQDWGDHRENEAFFDDGVHDQVLVVEAWHLPSGPGAKDGKHAICVDAGALLVEGWERDHFPFVFFRWRKPPRGFWGVGIAEDLNGVQVEINLMLRKIQVAFQILALPRIFIDASSKINKAHINNEIGAFVPYVGAPPIVTSPQTFHPEFFAHLERLWQRGFEMVGLTMDSAAPSYQAVSGIAAQTQHEISTERFKIQLKDFEDALVQRLAPIMVAEAKALHAQGVKIGVPAKKDRESIEHIEWGDIDLEEDQYNLVVFRQSSLPSLPGPRQDRVFMLLEAGMVDMATAKELIDLPDLESHMALDRAASDDIDRIIEQMLDEGFYEAPEPYMDLNLALKKVQLALNLAKKNGAPEDVLELLRQFLRQTHELEQRAQAEQQKVAMAAGQAGGLSQNGVPAPAPGAPPAPGIDGAPPTAAMPQDGVM
jgi:hypothetical protein